MIFELFGGAIEALFVIGIIYLAGILTAQSIKLLPLFLGLSEVMRVHRTFPVEDYLQLRTLLKMAPYNLLVSSIQYTIDQLFQGGIAAFLGSLLGMVGFWVIFLVALFHGLFYFRLRSFLLLPVRFVINLN
jgi:hypothetical protein